MTYILTLIANPEKNILNEVIINKVFIALEKKEAQITDLRWLSRDRACEIMFELDRELIIDLNLDKYHIDYAILNSNNRRKKFLISDMDSTLINQECIDELADTLGLKEKVASITEKAMNNELDFKEALRERVALLKGLEESVLERVYKEKITIMSGAKSLVATMKKNGAYCLLVSGGFTFFTDKITKLLGFDEHHANNLEFLQGKLTGKVIEPILDKESKLSSLINGVNYLGICADDVVAIGDGANDLPMIQKAGLGVAYHAKPNVQKQAKIKINHTDLRSILYIQGYKDDEIIS